MCRITNLGQGYGIATFPSEKVAPSTLFYTGSTTKAFLGAAWARLIESDENQKKESTEKISYDTPLATLIRDDFIVQDDYATNHITIEDALSHRTGMSGYDLSYGGPINTPKRVVRNLRHFPLTAELRTQYQYCNTMYVAASHAFETVTGLWLGKTLKETIWEPLDMHHTFFSLQDAQNAVDSGAVKLARGYFWDDGGEDGEGKYTPQAYMDFPEASGAGCIISSVLDYAEWLKALINCSAPLNEKILTEMVTPRAIVARKSSPWDGVTTYALGWALNTYKGEIVTMHTGGLIGFETYLLYLPNRKWGIVLMANTTPSSGHMVHEVLAMTLLDEFLGIASDRRYDSNAKQAFPECRSREPAY
jgi:CubicO group peptidase (beta-lactamase class C family)